MKRMKKVFNSNSQVAHLWANQSQSEARASSTFFQGTKLYSYGYHYLSGQIHTVKGKKFAIINSAPYSVTTSKHLSDARYAVSGLMPYFRSPTPSNPKATVKWLDDQAKGTLNLALTRQKITTQGQLRGILTDIQDHYIHTNRLRFILGLKPLKVNQKDLNKVRKHLEARLKRYHELNTPEMIAKREHKANLKKLADAKKKEQELIGQVAAFRSGASGSIYGLPFQILRIQGDTVKTSGGAEVPLQAAKLLCRALLNGHKILGAKVGAFQVVSVKDMGDDKAVKIGCHNILLSEACNVLNTTNPTGV